MTPSTAEQFDTPTPMSSAPAVPLHPDPQTSGDEPVAVRPPGVWWLWHPLQGGTGASTLATALPGGMEITDLDDPARPRLPVVVVTRGHHGGLVAAQQWAAAHPAGTIAVAGLVIVADAPGRTPRPLEALGRLVSGGYPQTWRIPWVPAWRLGATPTPANTPKAAKALLGDLATLTQPATSEGTTF